MFFVRGSQTFPPHGFQAPRAAVVRTRGFQLQALLFKVSAAESSEAASNLQDVLAQKKPLRKSIPCCLKVRQKRPRTLDLL